MSCEIYHSSRLCLFSPIGTGRPSLLRTILPRAHTFFLDFSGAFVDTRMRPLDLTKGTNPDSASKLFHRMTFRDKHSRLVSTA